MASQTSSRRGKKAAAKRDRLSALPDGVLHRVLRFLDARHPVAVVSLLSRRWRHLWATSPSPTPTTPSASGARSSSSATARRRRCALSASTAATAPPSPTTTGGSATPSAATATTASARSTSTSAAELTVSAIAHCEVIAPKSVVNLPLLTKLHLFFVKFGDDDASGLAAERLSAGCPALEDVSLSQCSLGSFRVSFGNVKTLSITDCEYSDIHVDAPNTRSLRLTVSSRVHLEFMPSLVSAWVYFCGNGPKHLAPCRYALLAALRNVQHLELLRFSLFLQFKGIMGNNSSSEILLFSELKSLYLGEWLVCDFYQPFAYFLRCASNWVTLTIDEWGLYDMHNVVASEEMPMDHKPSEKMKLVSALCGGLETLRFRISKRDDMEEFRRMRVLLKETTKPTDTVLVWF
ncbi:unnamed protein product [Urochloa decumbens]|uniref:F-box domain-containing protein n=1 Tax=Urochloa decumbens TaxID=240449 RepID=A0ABC9A111_9POAL